MALKGCGLERLSRVGAQTIFMGTTPRFTYPLARRAFGRVPSFTFLIGPEPVQSFPSK